LHLYTVRCICDGKGYDWNFNTSPLQIDADWWTETVAENFFAELADAKVCGYGATATRAWGRGLHSVSAQLERFLPPYNSANS
jgi:hypothetical protein